MEPLSYIICGKLYNGIDEELKENQKILIRGKYIQEVGPKIQRPESAKVMDLSHLTVTPGMIDAHMHMDFYDWRSVREETYFHSEEAKTLAILRTAQKALARGFTTVRHPGGGTTCGTGVLDVKRAIEKGYHYGARIVAAPRFMCSPGSHGDMFQQFATNPQIAGLLQRQMRTMGSGCDFFVNAVREEIKYGADFIKIMATGGFFSPNDSPVQQQLSDEEMKTIIRTAHECGKTVTAHVYCVEHIRKLAEYGIDGMEHCSLIDEDTAELLADRDIYIVPTFCPYEEAIHYDPVKLQMKNPQFREKLEYYKEALQKGREVIKHCKCRLGYGTDLVAVHQNYESGYEYQAWMESGMGGFRALHAATKVNAQILQLDDKIGTIEPGKYADISGWGRDLLTDSKALLDCRFVMKEGVEYSAESCLSENSRTR